MECIKLVCCDCRELGGGERKRRERPQELQIVFIDLLVVGETLKCAETVRND